MEKLQLEHLRATMSNGLIYSFPRDLLDMGSGAAQLMPLRQRLAKPVERTAVDLTNPGEVVDIDDGEDREG